MSANAAEADHAVDAAVTQLHRTARWLQNLPLTRLAAHDRYLPRAANDVVNRIDALTRTLAQHSDAAADCPPSNSRPHELADAAAGVQLTVFIDQLERVLAHPAVSCPPASAAELARLGQLALELRRG